MKFKNQFNRQDFQTNYETNTGKSLTIPDQTMTIQEIMTKYAQGIPFDITKEGQFHGEEFIPDIDRMDLSERYQLLDEVKKDVKEKQKLFTKKPKKIETTENTEDTNTGQN
jgi:hypothetical protein